MAPTGISRSHLGAGPGRELALEGLRGAPGNSKGVPGTPAGVHPQRAEGKAPSPSQTLTRAQALLTRRGHPLRICRREKPGPGAALERLGRR